MIRSFLLWLPNLSLGLALAGLALALVLESALPAVLGLVVLAAISIAAGLAR